MAKVLLKGTKDDWDMAWAECKVYGERSTYCILARLAKRQLHPDVTIVVSTRSYSFYDVRTGRGLPSPIDVLPLASALDEIRESFDRGGPARPVVVEMEIPEKFLAERK